MNTEAKSNEWIRTLVLTLTAVATAWGTMKMELSSLVKQESTVASIAIRSDAVYEIEQRVDSAAAVLEHRIAEQFAALSEDFTAQLASLPEPKTITRTVLVPSGPDSAQSVALAEHIADLDNALRDAARERARERNQFEEWREWIRANGFLRREKTKHNGDGH